MVILFLLLIITTSHLGMVMTSLLLYLIMHYSNGVWVYGNVVFIYILNKRYSKSFEYMEMRFLFLYIDYAFKQSLLGKW